MLAQGLVVNELMGENRAGTAEGVCLVEVGMCRSKGASCEQRKAQLLEHCCIMCILWLCGVCLSLKSRPNPGLLVLGSIASGCIASRNFKLFFLKRILGANKCAALNALLPCCCIKLAQFCLSPTASPSKLVAMPSHECSYCSIHTPYPGFMQILHSNSF